MKKLQNVPSNMKEEVQKWGLVEFDKPFDPRMDERTLKKNIESEEQYDKSLDPIAEKIFALYQEAELEDRASKYWEIGDILDKFEKQLPDNRESYEKKTNYLLRLSEKIDDIATSKNPSENATTAPHSLRYLREFLDFRRNRKKSEVDDKIPWSIQFEFLDLPSSGWKHFVSLYHGGRLTNKEKIREAVHRYKLKMNQPASDADEKS